jgi:hypothetical protein
MQEFEVRNNVAEDFLGSNENSEEGPGPITGSDSR